MRRGVGREGLPDACHGGDRGGEIGVEPQPHGCDDGRAQAGRLVNVRPGRRQPEDVRGDLHRRIALRAAAGDAQLGDRRLAAALDALQPVAQRVGQPFQDGPIEMRPRVHVAEADDGALRFRARLFEARRPVGLEDQAHRAGRDVFHQRVELRLGRGALLVGERLLELAELVLEPVHHPVAAKDLDFEAVCAGDRGQGRAGSSG